MTDNARCRPLSAKNGRQIPLTVMDDRYGSTPYRVGIVDGEDGYAFGATVAESLD